MRKIDQLALQSDGPFPAAVPPINLSDRRLARNKQRDKAEAERQVIFEIIQGANTTANLDQLFAIIHQSVGRVLSAENCFVALHDPATDLLHLRFWVDKFDPVPPPPQAIGKSLSAYVLRTGRPLLVTDEIFRELYARGEVEMIGTDSSSWLGVPLKTPSKTIGVLVVQHYENKSAYSDRDVELLVSAGSQIALAIERKQAEVRLRDSEERFQLVTRATNDAIWDWNLLTNELWWSESFQTMFGYRADEVEPGIESWTGRLHPDDLERVLHGIHKVIDGGQDSWTDEYRFRCGDGSYSLVIDRGYVVRDGQGLPVRMLGSMMDITDRKHAEEKLLHDAFHDALTNLPNRALLLDRMQLAIDRARRRKDTLFAVLFLDLDRFKNVNDSLGHIVGDQLLVGIAQRLKNCVREIDTVARLGGDEFAILLDDIDDCNDAIWVADRVQKALAQSFNLCGHEVVCTVSIGIALSLTGYDRPEDLLRDADTAMYRAKTRGKARHEVFDKVMHANALELLKLETDLRRAIEFNEFCLYYQPIVSLEDNQISGFEALVRWKHPDRGLVTPMDFIPMAEETGLIIPLGRWVLREACRQMREWQLNLPGRHALKLSVNLSGKQFLQPDLVEQIKQILAETGFDPHHLHLEITESVVIENTATITAMLEQLKAMGIRLSMDDFGTGYSSLSYLHRFPIHTLKIDKSFISEKGTAGESEIVRTIIMLAAGLGMDVIAEGIETEDQLAQLKTLKCQYGQGFLFSYPLDAESAGALIATPVKSGQ